MIISKTSIYTNDLLNKDGTRQISSILLITDSSGSSRMSLHYFCPSIISTSTGWAEFFFSFCVTININLTFVYFTFRLSLFPCFLIRVRTRFEETRPDLSVCLPTFYIFMLILGLNLILYQFRITNMVRSILFSKILTIIRRVENR